MESMSQPRESIRGEMSDAVVGGIRQHGAEAVGLVLMGLARLFVGAATLGVLLVVGAVTGCDLTATRFMGAICVGAVVNLLVSGRTNPPGRRRLRS